MSNEELARSFLQEYRIAEEKRKDIMRVSAIEALRRAGLEVADSGDADLGNGWRIRVKGNGECLLSLTHKDSIPPSHASCEKCVAYWETRSGVTRERDIDIRYVEMEIGRMMDELLSLPPSAMDVYNGAMAIAAWHDIHRRQDAQEKEEEAVSFIRRLLGLG